MVIEKFKNSRQMERHLKGMANHYRIEILLFVADRKVTTFEDIINKLKANDRTIGDHVRRLEIAGLINKKRNKRFVELSLSPYGKMFTKFLKSFQSI